MRIVSCLITISIICGIYSCREAPAKGNSRQEYCESKRKNGNTKVFDVGRKKIYSVSAIEIPAYTESNNKILLSRKRYKTLYNIKNKIPDWVAWQLKFEHSVGPFKRLNVYFEDIYVPSPRAIEEDYKGVPWTHGHMCPAGDNKWDKDAMQESNLLTNICPQHSSLNSGLWNKIEQDCRKWSKKYGDLYIVCGPILYNRDHETIGSNNVVVPEAFFKVILCLTGEPKSIGFVVKNNEGKKGKDQFVNTVDEVERITGIDFFPALPDSIENEVEAYANLDDWR